MADSRVMPMEKTSSENYCNTKVRDILPIRENCLAWRLISAPKSSTPVTKFVTLLTDSFSPYPPFRWSGGRLSSSKASGSHRSSSGYAFPPSDRDPRFPHQRSTRPYLFSALKNRQLLSVSVVTFFAEKK